MKSLFAPLLWAIAAFVAVAVLYRIWRGKPVVLRGKWSPRVIRIVAIVLVACGFATKEKTVRLAAEPVDTKKSQPASDFPATLTPDVIVSWHQRQSASDPWRTFKQNFTKLKLGRSVPMERDLQFLPAVLRSHFAAELKAIEQNQPRAYTGDELIGVLDQAERSGFYDHWFIAHLWRKSASVEPAQRPAVYARLHQSSRATDALIRCFFEVKPTLDVSARAWGSKAGPSAAERQATQVYLNQIKEIHTMASKLYAVLDEGTWKRDAVTRLKLTKGSAIVELHRGIRRQACQPLDEFRYGRLDVLITPKGESAAIIEHGWLGEIKLPAGQHISVWELPSLLSDVQKKRLDEEVAAALNGNEDAADRLEAALPLAHAAVRTGLKEQPGAKFAPRLRLILALFDDTVMPAVPDVRSPRFEEFDRFGR